MVVPRHRLSTVGRRAFAVHGPMVWNSLPDDLRAQKDYSAHSRTMSLLDRAWKPGFSLRTSVFSALETFVTIELYKPTLNHTIPYHNVRVCLCEMQTGLLRYITVNHGLGCSLALLQLLLPSLNKDHLPCRHRLSRRHLHHCLDARQVLAARLQARQSRLVDVCVHKALQPCEFKRQVFLYFCVTAYSLAPWFVKKVLKNNICWHLADVIDAESFYCQNCREPPW